MKTKTFCTLFIALFLFFGCNTKTQKQPDLKIWYDKPATDWMTEALPIGNGYTGTMFFGGVQTEQLQFSEGSLWSGGPGSHPDYNFGIREGVWKNLEKIRGLINEGKMEEANHLANSELKGIIHAREGAAFGDYGAQQTMGDLFVSVNHSDQCDKYRREIDLNMGEGRVSYETGGKKYNRIYFGSYPDKAMVYRFESEVATDYAIQFKTPHLISNVAFDVSVQRFSGKVADNGMEFEMCLKLDTDGKITSDETGLKVSGATKLTVYQFAATDYLPEYPTYKGNDYAEENRLALNNLQGKSFEEIRKNHRADYQNLFKRVALDLGENSRDSIPTDRRLLEYAQNTIDPGLEEIYFQYSRYMMIASSRDGALPMHLQGKWNNSTNPPWAADYHTNINLQMLYWPAEVSNLPECHTPLFDYMESLVEPGKQSAREFFNTRGWVVNTMNNTFGYTSPGWGFPWGYYPGGAGWLCQHLWEHFAFTNDTVFLREQAWPLMKEAALFWVDYLTADQNGFLVSNPSYSPEHGGISGGASMDHQIAWDLFNNCIEAGTILKTDEEFRKILLEKRDKIFPPTIGKWGQLQEWKEDVDDPENKHRHVSHLYALHPGKQITPETTPELAEAAKVSLIARGDEGTGWSLAWKINFWARLKDGDRAYKLFKRLLRPTGVKGTNMSDGGGSYYNLLCAHPPFQLDGNMGACAGIAEMLVQSHTDVIELLPALPESWKNGSVNGLKARGNFEVDINWENGLLKLARITGTPGQSAVLKYEDKNLKFTLNKKGIFETGIF